ncbi:PEP/pyruvate-binding domain-containing protein [Rhodoblastus sp.]|uniref:PEP/pyruvate-binding domain-containing protein n=1 Tax=Rhodoblastus sp. TaxID=1962975 RepID=UPI003F977F6B
MNMPFPAPIIRARDAADPVLVGGKAASLAALTSAGFDVPPFVVLTTRFFDDMRRPANIASLFPGAEKFAVRSSACDEDGAANSHAGQYLSILNVEPDQIVAAALRVRGSGREDNVELYRAARGVGGTGSAPAVIVQEMVAARVAGVAFSADPVTGRRDRVFISAIAGLGDRLVGGEEDGETYVVIKGTPCRIERAPDDPRVLSDADVAAVTDLACKVEATQACPQDIEWAFEGDRLFLLQARPITTPLRPSAIADPLVTVFDNSNIVESYPGMVSPLTFSFAQYAYARVYVAFVRLLGVPRATVERNRAVFENMLGRVEGRVYYKLDNWYRALSLLPGYRLNRSFMETMMGLDEPLPVGVFDHLGAPPARGLAFLGEVFRICGAALGIVAAAVRLPLTRRDFQARLAQALSQSEFAVIDALPPTGLAALYRRIEADLLDRWDAPLVNDFLCMIAFGMSRKLLERWTGEEGRSLHNSYLIGQGDIISAEPAQRIRRMAELLKQEPSLVALLASGDGTKIAPDSALAAEIASYVQKFGDRCAEELKLESATLVEDPTPLYRAIAGAATAQTAHAPERVDAEVLIAQRLSNRPFRRFLAMAVLQYARKRVRDRENLRFERTRIFGRARRVFVALGVQFRALGLIDDPRDIFLLTVEECLGAVEGGGVDHDLRALAALRKTEMDAARQKTDPPGRLIVAGAAVLVDSAAKASAPAPTGASRRGVGCSAGQVTARGRVITDPRGQSLQPGEVLVARHTDPGWIALFTNASAIIVERGSLLSHSAIVARELGIPCVVGVKDATRWVRDGELLRVDGGAGVVEKIDG